MRAVIPLVCCMPDNARVDASRSISITYKLGFKYCRQDTAIMSDANSWPLFLLSNWASMWVWPTFGAGQTVRLSLDKVNLSVLWSQIVSFTLTYHTSMCSVRLRLPNPYLGQILSILFMYMCISSNLLRFISGLHVGSCLYCGTSGIWGLTVFPY